MRASTDGARRQASVGKKKKRRVSELREIHVAFQGLLNISIPWHIHVLDEIDMSN